LAASSSSSSLWRAVHAAHRAPHRSNAFTARSTPARSRSTACAPCRARPSSSRGPRECVRGRGPPLDPRVFELGVPILGICYGRTHRPICREEVETREQRREYGQRAVRRGASGGDFPPLLKRRGARRWMSHGDRTRAPTRFQTHRRSAGIRPFAPFGNPSKRNSTGVAVSTPRWFITLRGPEVLAAFSLRRGRLRPTWTPGTFTRGDRRRPRPGRR